MKLKLVAMSVPILLASLGCRKTTQQPVVENVVTQIPKEEKKEISFEERLNTLIAERKKVFDNMTPTKNELYKNRLPLFSFTGNDMVKIKESLGSKNGQVTSSIKPLQELFTFVESKNHYIKASGVDRLEGTESIKYLDIQAIEK